MKMTDTELLALISTEEQQAVGYQYGTLASERETAMNYYMGRAFGNEVEGKSQVISTDVRDAVEGMLPSLLDMFTSSKEAVEFEPVGMEDEAQAKAATALCNYVFYKQNNGFLLLYQWFKDALLQKNGVVKFWYQDDTKKTKETYEDLNELELFQLLQNPNVEVSATQEMEDGRQEIEITVTDKSGKVCVQNVPPEEFLITPKHNSVGLQDCLFVAHRQRLTVSEIKEMGYDVADNTGDSGLEFSPEFLARRQFPEETLENDPNDPSLRRVWITECYLRVDYDGDGVAELRKVLRCGQEILENEETDYIPFAAVTPIIMPHRFYGLSLADLVMEIQYHKSILWRQMMDNLYLTNNPRNLILENQVNLDDLLTSRVGGIVRQKVPGAVTPLETRFIAGQSFPMLEYLDAVKENRSGVTRYNQGTDADSLNKTATGISRIMNASEQRIKLVARIFAETGVKDLFRGILHCLQKYSTAPMQMRLLGNVTVIDPRQWKTQWDVTVNVGLGTGDKSQQLVQLQTIAAVQKELLMAGKAWVTDENLYNMSRKIAESAGFQNEGMFFTPPANVPPQEPAPDPEMMKLQAESQISQAELQQQSQEKALSAQMQKYVADLQAQTQVEVIRIQEQSKQEIAKFNAENEARMAIFEQNNAKNEADGVKQEMGKGLESVAQQMMQAHQQLTQSLAELAQAQAAQQQVVKKIVGAITGDRKIVRDEMGNAAGVQIIPSKLEDFDGPITQRVLQ
jgi:hypothetical protein